MTDNKLIAIRCRALDLQIEGNEGEREDLARAAADLLDLLTEVEKLKGAIAVSDNEVPWPIRQHQGPSMQELITLFDDLGDRPRFRVMMKLERVGYHQKLEANVWRGQGAGPHVVRRIADAYAIVSKVDNGQNGLLPAKEALIDAIELLGGHHNVPEPGEDT